MERIKIAMLGKYGPEGDFVVGSWKEDSDKLFGPRKAAVVWKLMQNAGLIPPYENGLVFVSPTANIATHELAIWQRDSSQREGKNLFLIGDLLPGLDPKPVLGGQDISDDKGHRLAFFRWDAESLPVKPNSVDVIWDRKGWVWHLAADIKSNPRLIRTFRNYHHLLKPGGSLVLDANDQFDHYVATLSRRDRCIYMKRMYLDNIGSLPKSRPSQFYPGLPIGQYERSTVNQIDRLDPDLWTDLEKYFRIQDIGRGVFKHRVLIKK